MRLSGSELVTISLLFLLISLAAAQDQYYDDEDQVGSGGVHVCLTSDNSELETGETCIVNILPIIIAQ